MASFTSTSPFRSPKPVSVAGALVRGRGNNIPVDNRIKIILGRATKRYRSFDSK